VWYAYIMSNENTNDNAPGQVYILHFNKPYWNNARGKCTHYVGYTTIGAEERINLHRKGQGSLLVKYAHKKLGIDFEVGLVEDYPDRMSARYREMRLKKEGHLSRHCKICRGEK